MAELSPAAQAVLAASDAAAGWSDQYFGLLRREVAAALRAAADQVVPEEEPPCGGMRPGGTGALDMDEARQFQRAATRRKLRGIATELGHHAMKHHD